MKPPWRPIVTAFSIWFAHFMACWAAGEIWPHQWHANVLAWGATAAASMALGVQFMRVKARPCRLAQGAIAIATAAVLFGALPSVVFVPAG
ncbi:hypothetical protein [Pelomonas sp. Root1444]|uniref:hypothetical protein n=1 Tax=Pelomonas sp. Root1444 TaxID=1736464 RepID=UPI0007037D95|nr:hypothetical protein [Pelomonas sp. Root1444]KQY85992.1 hypothetical protein ASD35_20375 [Pelomonas sp. Root1444]